MEYRLFSIQLAEEENTIVEREGNLMTVGRGIEEAHEFCYLLDVSDCEADVESTESRRGSSTEKWRDGKLVTDKSVL